jgi:hypothetical protein
MTRFKVTTSEIKEIKQALQSGMMFENESAHFFACIDKDGDSVFFKTVNIASSKTTTHLFVQSLAS